MPRIWSFWPFAGRFCLFWRLFHVEEVDGDWTSHGEIVSVFFDRVDCSGFDVFDGVEESVDPHEAVKIVDSDASECGFESEAVFVEDFGGFRLGGEDSGKGGEVVDGVHCGIPFGVISCRFRW